MASDAMEEYFIYENRLATFTIPQSVPAKRRGSNASSRAPKALSWPHKSIKPSAMAKAGFVFTPLPSNPDNVTCFLCTKALDGWEQDDNPLEEHLKHSPECGWAITAAVEAELGEYAAEDPRDALMVEARKATFGDGKWPHETRKGWSGVKTKALVEAGWIYTPLVGSDDNATCAYCQLALDGWEKSDKPWDEHYNRAPHCPFFSLISSKPAPKKAGRSKAARSSKASRLSLQSVALGVSDIALLADATAEIDDSIVTTASNMTATSKTSKKTAKGRKAPASRAKKSRTKKSEAVEVHDDEPKPEAEPQGEEREFVPPSSPKPAHGRKRSSEEVDDSALTNAEAPALKKRATKTRKARGSSATEVSSADTEMTDVLEEVNKSAVKKGTRKASATRKPSAKGIQEVSISTMASSASPPSQMPDDDEIDRQLEADLERPLDDEDNPMDADPETRRAAASRKEQGAADVAVEEDLTKTTKTDFAMFDPNPPQPTDDEIEAELQAMQDGMDVEVREPESLLSQKSEPEQQELKVTNKGRKAGTRKVSKQTTTKKTKQGTAPVAQQPQSRMPTDAEEPDEIAEAEVSFASAGTVKRTSVGRASLGRASLPRASLDSAAETAATKGPVKRGRPAKERISHFPIEEPAVVAHSDSVVYPPLEPVETDDAASTVATKAPAKRGRPAKKKLSQVPAEGPVEITPPSAKEAASQRPVEGPAEAAFAPDPVVYPTLEAMEIDDEPTPKPAVKSEKSNTTGKPRGRPPKSKHSSSGSGEPTVQQAPAESELELKPESEPALETEVEAEGETKEAHVQEKFSSTVTSPQVWRKPVPAPNDSPFAIQRQALESAPLASSEVLAPKTPRHHAASSQSAKQATMSPSPSPQASDAENNPPPKQGTLSPSPSPQASDAENNPPSSKPSTNRSKGNRIPLGELPVTTPARQTSPSRQQQGRVIAGLQSTEAWTAVDLDLIFEGDENSSAEQFFPEGGELSSAERAMTVEDWIYHNAGQAELKLKSECEAMVSAFEKEGTRAMRVLEGIVAEA